MTEYARISDEKVADFAAMQTGRFALTFDDLILRTGRSHVDPRQQDTRSWFSLDVDLEVPIISAAMDTITESEMAIAMAKLGGLGVIHAGLDVKAQRNEARQVKFHLSGLIDRPITFSSERSLESILRECAEMPYHFRTFPITDGNNRMIGMLSGKDFEFPDDLSVNALEAMRPIEELIWAPAGTPIDEAYRIMQRSRSSTLPLLDEDGRVAGLYVFKDVSAIKRGDTAPYNVDEQKRLRVGLAIPTNDTALPRVEASYGKYADVFVIDTSQGDSDYAVRTLQEIMNAYPDAEVVAGNISDGPSAVELVKAGARGIKVGQGGGSICSTRVETGSGRPQVTAVYECVRALEDAGLYVPVCSDGGIAYRGAIPIAIAAGAHSVMVGNLVAGTIEAAGAVFEEPNGTKWKIYRGMGSLSAQRASSSARDRYSAEDIDRLLAEGVEAAVPLKGPVSHEIELAVMALRRGMSMGRSKNIESHRRNARLERVTAAGSREGKPHDVTIISLRDIANRLAA